MSRSNSQSAIAVSKVSSSLSVPSPLYYDKNSAVPSLNQVRPSIDQRLESLLCPPLKEPVLGSTFILVFLLACYILFNIIFFQQESQQQISPQLSLGTHPPSVTGQPFSNNYFYFRLISD